MQKNSEPDKVQDELCKNLNSLLKGFAAPYKVDHRNAKMKDPFRNSFQRDRDRIIHSRAFRRLDKKTQAFPLFESDHARTRMTHTLEVFQIADSIAKRLKLNDNLTAAISFGHDLGHTPFGHAGERALNNIAVLLNKTGFKHNYQSLKIVNDFEKFDLNIETRDGILHHTSLSYDKRKLGKGVSQLLDADALSIPLDYFDPELKDFYCYLRDSYDINNSFSFSVEGQIVALADEIAQKEHDTDDAVRFNLIDIRELISEFRKKCPRSAQYYSDFFCSVEEYSGEALKNKFISYLTGLFISDACKSFTPPDYIEISHEKYGLIRVMTSKSICFSLNGQELFDFLDSYLKEHYLNNYKVKRLDSRAEYLIKQLFKAFWVNPEQMHETTFGKFLAAKNLCKGKKEKCIFESNLSLKNAKQNRDKLCSQECFPLKVIFNTISGMTDYYFYKEYQSLYMPPAIL